MPSFDDLKKNLSSEKSEPNVESEGSNTAVVRVSKKDETIIEVEDETLEGAILEACSHFNTHRQNLKMKIKQKGSKGLLGVGKKNYIIIFKYYEPSQEQQKTQPVDGTVRIHVKNDGVYIKVRQGKNGGKEITEDLVSKMLVERKIREYNREKIKESLHKKEGEWIQVGGPVKSNPDWNSKAKVEVAKNKMKATMVISPPILSGKTIDKDTVMNILNEQNVTYGIKEDEIEHAIDECIYGKSIIIAEGKSPIDGTDAYMDFKFKTNPENDLELKEDQFGKVDYFNLVGMIQNVVEDQILAVKVPATRGQSGMTVTGEVIEAQDGEDIELPLGKNTKASDNGMEVISMLQGQAVYNAGLINVEPVYKVNGNVDLKTGKIVFLGTVIVTGDVEDGFGVKATQNIEIGGTVGRCEIEAEGNIVIKGGIQGKSTLRHHDQTPEGYEDDEDNKEPEGYVKAGKNVFAKFINGSIVKSDKDIIVSDAIYHSKVTARDRIICLGRKGRIVGGKLVASKEINAKEIGSRNSYTLTEIEVGTDPDAKEKLLTFEYELREKEESLKKMRQNLEQLNKQREQNKGILPPDKEVMMKKLKLGINEHMDILEEIKEDIANLKSYLDDIKTSGKVGAREYIYPGVHIQIKEVIKKIERENQYVTYILEGGEIRDIQYQEVSKEIREQVEKELESKKKKKR